MPHSKRRKKIARRIMFQRAHAPRPGQRPVFLFPVLQVRESFRLVGNNCIVQFARHNARRLAVQAKRIDARWETSIWSSAWWLASRGIGRAVSSGCLPGGDFFVGKYPFLDRNQSG